MQSKMSKLTAGKKTLNKKPAPKKVPATKKISAVYNPKTKQAEIKTVSKKGPRMILDKRWKDADLQSLAAKHNMKPKKYVEEMVLNHIAAHKDLQLSLFTPPLKKKK